MELHFSLVLTDGSSCFPLACAFRVYMCLRACTCISRALANGFPLECSSRVASLMAGEHLSSVLLTCDRATRPGHYFSRSCFRSSPGRCPGVGAARLGRRRAVGFLSSAHGRTIFCAESSSPTRRVHLQPLVRRFALREWCQGRSSRPLTSV